MINSFEVKDYALIEHIFVEFAGGLNIITGETGAGKSILIDAMGLLLGERASSEVVRKGADKSVVEGIFHVENNKRVKSLLNKNEMDCSTQLIVRREISRKGTNRCFVNDSPVPLSFIKDLGNLLVDLHGQHEHQSLLRMETHIDYLDEFGNYNDLLAEYKYLYKELVEAKNSLSELKKREEILKEKKEIHLFQMKEIDNVAPEAGEEEKLNEQLKKLENYESLAELTSEIYQVLYESEESVHDRIVKVKNNLAKLAEVDKAFSESSNEAETIIALVNDISSFVRSYKSNVVLDREQIEEIRERLGAIILLKKRYGGSVDSVLEHRKKIGDEFALAENFEEKINDLQNNVEQLKKKAGSAAAALSKKRTETSIEVKNGIEKTLKDLGIAQATFTTKLHNEFTDKDGLIITKKYFQYNSRGIDKVEFFVSTNPGEDVKPLAKVASGGEISRIMLSLKSTLAKSDKLPLLIFDEIDVGVSGRIAQKVGKALSDLSSFHQIIAITHLPQIAGAADHHYSIEKISKDGRVVSSIKKLNDDERVTEVARLISGEDVTDAALKSARELLELESK